MGHPQVGRPPRLPAASIARRRTIAPVAWRGVGSVESPRRPSSCCHRGLLFCGESLKQLYYLIFDPGLPTSVWDIVSCQHVIINLYRIRLVLSIVTSCLSSSPSTSPLRIPCHYSRSSPRVSSACLQAFGGLRSHRRPEAHGGRNGAPQRSCGAWQRTHARRTGYDLKEGVSSLTG